MVGYYLPRNTDDKKRVRRITTTQGETRVSSVPLPYSVPELIGRSLLTDLVDYTFKPLRNRRLQTSNPPDTTKTLIKMFYLLLH